MHPIPIHAVKSILFLCLSLAVAPACAVDDTVLPQGKVSDLDTPGYTFTPFDFPAELADPTVDRLCQGWDRPAELADKVFIDCKIDGFDFSLGAEPEPKRELTIMAFNLERGLRLKEQLAWMKSAAAPKPDVILISEADRGCSRSGSVNVMAEWAKALGMYGVFVVEFVELARDGDESVGIEAACEHGNGILSRYPLGNVHQIRHQQNVSWYDPQGSQPRLGGRIAAAADVKVGDQIVHAVSLHFESNADEDLLEAQANELLDFLDAKPHQKIVGGDTNAPFYFLDLMGGGKPIDRTTQTFFNRGYVDSHAALPYEERVTHDPALVLDIIFGSGDFFTAPKICMTCKLSDHHPVWATMEVR